MTTSLFKYLVVLTLLMLPRQAKTQQVPPWSCGHTTLVTFDTTRGNRRIPVSVYYPSTTDGRNKPLAGEGSLFPVIVFGHGFKLSEDNYRNIVDLLVPEGFIVAFPLKERGFLPSHGDLAKDIAFVVRQFHRWNLDSSSMFAGRISPFSCAMGHSMGGGAAVVAASLEPKITTLAGIALFNTTPSAVEAARTLTIPSLVMAGSLDCVTPPEIHQVPVYETLASSDKTYISITGGTHCGMTTTGRLCHLAESSCRPQNSLPSPEQQTILKRYLLTWLKSRVMDNQAEINNMEKSLSEDLHVTWRSSTSGTGHTD